jgi:hypothetical protein
MRAYKIIGLQRTIIIERAGPSKYFVLSSEFCLYRDGFFSTKFRRLTDAREFAERLAGIV